MQTACALILVPFILLSIGCYDYKAAEKEVQFAAFEHMTKDISPNTPIFAHIGKKRRPDKDMMVRLQELTLTVKDGNAWEAHEGMPGLFDKETGEQGVAITIREAEWLDRRKAKIQTSYYSSGLNAARFTYTIEFIDDTWTVTNVQCDRMS